ncbi:hypothetical protein [Sodalis sp. RH16]|uniref:hypothetical protein n=1 Tax=Sodalis sp. RH16 TaxID=3394331 RepID=UPI0039B4DCD0
MMTRFFNPSATNVRLLALGCAVRVLCAMALDVWIGVNPRSECLSEAQRIMEMMAQACAE